MNAIFTVQDRQDTFDTILSAARQCDKTVSLVQVGSGAHLSPAETLRNYGKNLLN